MIYGPSKVDVDEQQTAGIMMVTNLNYKFLVKMQAL
jgi:hypothetical protein